MEVVHPRCAGLDVHKKGVVACVVVPGSAGKAAKEIRSFGTMTDDLLKLSDWLAAHQVTHVAMESTGAYWKPIYNLLEGQFEVLLVNAQHIKNVPGRKTDVKDSEWIADLLRHGLLRPSFVPDRDQRELRELTRYRVSLVRERAAEVNRLQKVLEGANIKLASVTSDVLGMSGRAILEQLVAGSTDSAAMANLAKGKLRKKVPLLEQALKGSVAAHQRFMVARQLEHIDFLDQAIEEVSSEIRQRLGREIEGQGRPFEEAVELLDTIPGIGPRIAEGVIAEIGVVMARFPTAGHLASWAGLAPGNNESAGKRKSGRTRKGSPSLRAQLVEAAQAAAHTKDTYLSALYHRVAAHRGHKKAIIAVAHAILIIIYRLLDRKEPYRDLGANYYDERNRQAAERHLVKRLERLGNKVTIEPIQTAA